MQHFLGEIKDKECKCVVSHLLRCSCLPSTLPDSVFHTHSNESSENAVGDKKHRF